MKNKQVRALFVFLPQNASVPLSSHSRRCGLYTRLVTTESRVEQNCLRISNNGELIFTARLINVHLVEKDVHKSIV